MPNYESRLQFLYQRFILDEASSEEIREFWELIEGADEANPIKKSVLALYDDSVPPEIELKNWDGVADRITREPEPLLLSKGLAGKRANRWWAAAASVALLLGAFVYLYYGARNPPFETASFSPIQLDTQDVAPPAAVRATITLADSTKIFLDNMGTGMLARQNNVELKKTGDGKIIYDKKAASSDTEIIFNTLTNPRGSRAVSMALSDGSQLWLNAGSSVTFPVAFNGPERKISITGEAYFEVAHDPSKKFIVMANQVATEVLGTHFNVNAHGDKDAAVITLLEGSVKVIASNGSSSMVKPGGQVVETLEGKLKTKAQVDVEEVIAWKNETFLFNNTNIKDIMKEVSRWYDVEIAYKDDFTELSFGGNMSRQKNLSELLQRLEATQAVKFEVSGRKITVVKTK